MISEGREEEKREIVRSTDLVRVSNGGYGLSSSELIELGILRSMR